jgi:hypothetical protein
MYFKIIFLFSKVKLHTFFLLIFYIFSFNVSKGNDSLKTKDKPVFVVQIDRRNSFIRNNHVDINGLLFAFQYKHRHQIGLGFYCLEPWKKPSVLTKQDTAGSYQETIKFNLYYSSLNYNYTFFRRGIIEMGLPVEAGFGFAHVKVAIPKDNFKASVHSFFIPVQIGYFLRLKVTRWFAINGSVGYRKLVLKKLVEKEGTNINYDGFYYHYGINIYFKNIIADLKKRKERRKALK